MAARELAFEKGPGGTLRPVDEESRERMTAWKAGDVIRVKASKMRNGDNHRRFFQLLRATCDHLPEGQEMTQRQLLHELKLKTGRYQTRISPVPTKLGRELKRGVKRLRTVYRWMEQHAAPRWVLGQLGRLGQWLAKVAESDAANTVLEPESIDFGSMDESEFQVFYRECSDIICRDYLDVSEAEFEEMVNLL